MAEIRPRMTAAQTASGQIGTPTGTMNSNRLDGVLGTRGLVAASKSKRRKEGGQHWRNHYLIQPQTAGQQLLEEIHDVLVDDAAASSRYSRAFFNASM